MIKVMVVYDEDPLYAGRLAEYVNQKETFPFQAMAFSDLEKLKAYGRDHEIAILLVGERVREEAKEIKAGLKMLREKKGALIQELLAVEIGVTQQMLSKYEKDITIIKVRCLKRIAEYLM